MSVASSTIAIRLAGAVDAEAMAAIHARLLRQELERGRDRTIRDRAWLSFAPRLAVTANKRCKGSLSSEAPATRLKS